MTVSGPVYLFRRGRIYYVQYALAGVIKQKSTGCTTKCAATAYVEVSGTRSPFDPSRLSEYIRDYLKLKQGILRQSTLTRIDQIGRKFLRTLGDRLLNEFNRENLDDVGPIGGAEQGMKVLQEMNSLADDHEEFVKSLAPSVVVR